MSGENESSFPPDDNQMTTEQFLAIRKEAGLQMNPATVAEIFWCWGCEGDPYGINPPQPEEDYGIGRQYFARSFGSDVWVSFADIPDDTLKALRARMKAGDFDDPSLARHVFPKDPSNAVKDLKDQDLDQLHAAVLSELQRRGNHP